jgi:alkylation response protein AidB-like acyl-CoA dehydrogenase
VPDLDERLLLRGTAQEVFASDPSIEDIAQLGWLGLLTAENAGGEGWFPYEAALIAMEGGRAGTASTWFMTALAAAFLSRTPEAQKKIAALLSGDQVAAFAGAPLLTMTAGTVTGTVSRVLSERAPDVVVLAGPPAIGPIVTTTQQPGVAVHPNVETLETARRLFRLTLDTARVDSVDRQAVASLELLAIVLLSADTVGAVGRAVEIVTDHLVQREAFGVPIASFQVVQHRLVDLTLFHSASEALVLSAAGALALDEPRAEHLALAAHTYVGSRAVHALDDCIQLSGGIGFTWEFPVHNLLRRASTNAALLRSARTSRHQLAAVRGWGQ